MVSKGKPFVWLALSVALLAGCSNEKEEQKLTIQNFDIVDTYEYDKVKVVVEEEKTAEELAYDVLMDTMGLANNQEDGYKEVGINEKNGVFINAGILEGNQIPKVSGYSAEGALVVNDGGEQSETVKLEYFKELQKNREYKISSYDEDEALKETAEKIKQATLEQQIRIQEQEDAKFIQDAEEGVEDIGIEGESTGGTEESTSNTSNTEGLNGNIDAEE